MQSHRSIAKCLCGAASEAEMARYLAALLTESEAEEIARRIEIVKLLQRGYSQRDVAEKLGVGIATVSRGAKELKNGRFDFLNA